MNTEITKEAAGAAVVTCVRIKNTLLILAMPQRTYLEWERDHMDVAGGIQCRKESLEEVQELAAGLPGFGITYCQQLVDWAKLQVSRVPLHPTVAEEAEAARRAVNELQFFYHGIYSLLESQAANA